MRATSNYEKQRFRTALITKREGSCNMRKSKICCSIFLLLLLAKVGHVTAAAKELLLVTDPSPSADEFQRYSRSVRIYQHNIKVLDGEFSVPLLVSELAMYGNREDLVIVYTGSSGTIVDGTKKDILERFHQLESRIVFATNQSEGLNYNGFAGYAKDLLGFLEEQVQCKAIDCPRTDPELDNWGVQIDRKSMLFQYIDSKTAKNLALWMNNGKYPFLETLRYGNTAKIFISTNNSATANSLGNYLAKSWSVDNKCRVCEEDLLDPKSALEARVLLAVFVTKPTPFLEEFLHNLERLDFPKKQLDLIVFGEYHLKELKAFVSRAANYRSAKLVSNFANEGEARNRGVRRCVETMCDHYFCVDSDAQLEEPGVLRMLLEQNRPVVAPMLVRREQETYANFYGGFSQEGFYARSFDHVFLVKGERRGLWNVACITSCYLLRGSILMEKKTRPDFLFSKETVDPERSFCHSLSSNGVFMRITNMAYFGHLVDASAFEDGHVHGELWDMDRNMQDWERRYLHPLYRETLAMDVSSLQQPCQDVYWIPFVTEKFADDLVDEMVNFGQWSSGKHQDNRIDSGYEGVPTRDIHMKQIGLEEVWLEMLKLYVKPFAEKIFTGYTSDPPKSKMSFVVRYHPEEQPSLRPHFDTATYTINVALNHEGIDYKGGGCRFLRKNCSVTDTKKGWMLLHPGQLTHFHEGLPTTEGTRYILISFIDPPELIL